VKRIASKSAPSPTSAISAEDATDVVIAWVDGRDPQHRRKRQRYLADPGAMSSRSRWPVKTVGLALADVEAADEDYFAALGRQGEAFRHALQTLEAASVP
jgi:hypothetical protein